jgi:hypothetical protein
VHSSRCAVLNRGADERRAFHVVNGSVAVLLLDNRVEYPAQARNPKGEIHEDEAVISFDRARKVLVLRQFHVEGFVNQYVEEPGSTATTVGMDDPPVRIFRGFQK